MAAKSNGTKRISMAGGAKATGKTVPGPGSVRGGGTGAGGPSGKMQNTGGGGFGRTQGIKKGKGGMC
jgi:hypothetical protein